MIAEISLIPQETEEGFSGVTGMMKYKRLGKSCLSSSEEPEVFQWDAPDFVMPVKEICLSNLQIRRDNKGKHDEKKFVLKLVLL